MSSLAACSPPWLISSASSCATSANTTKSPNQLNRHTVTPPTESNLLLIQPLQATSHCEPPVRIAFLKMGARLFGGNHHFGTMFGQADRAGAPHAAGGAGDHCHFVIEPSH